jgi:hypothetical protein
MEGTDVWYKTLRLDYRLRTTYLLTPNAPALPHGKKVDDEILSEITVRQVRDPLNPKATKCASITLIGIWAVSKWKLRLLASFSMRRCMAGSL